MAIDIVGSLPCEWVAIPVDLSQEARRSVSIGRNLRTIAYHYYAWRSPDTTNIVAASRQSQLSQYKTMRLGQGSRWHCCQTSSMNVSEKSI